MKEEGEGGRKGKKGREGGGKFQLSPNRFSV